jgi:DNA invertase Pin-like site-specific DNA recombinase
MRISLRDVRDQAWSLKFEAGLAHINARGNMAVAIVRDRPRAMTPKPSTSQRRHLIKLHDEGEHTQAELAELFSISRTTVYRELQR